MSASHITFDGFVLDDRVNWFVRGAPNQNFGDFLPAMFCAQALARPRVEADMFLLVGSVVSRRHVRLLQRRAGLESGAHTAFWGCGARTGNVADLPDPRRSIFCGVRGPLTRNRLGLATGTPVGDPGLLLPLFHEPTVDQGTNGRAICIPHVDDRRDDAALLRASGAQTIVRPLVDATLPALRRCIDAIASAGFVLTASLHGAVVAAAYGRPFAFWDTGRIDIPFKWRDFAASIDMEPRFACNLDEAEAQAGVARISLPPLLPLASACPLAVRSAVLWRAALHDGEITQRDLDTALSVLVPLSETQSASVSFDNQRSNLVRVEAGAPWSATRRSARRQLEKMRTAAKRALRRPVL